MKKTMTTVLVAALALLVAAPAANANAFRFWGYFQWDGSAWGFATSGPADTQPADGDVEGWRFAVTDESATKLPRAEGDFAAICGETAASDGNKRVAVVIDYGAPEDADGETPPPAVGECAEVAEDASGADVLAAVAELRIEGGLICAINSFPATGCGDAVDGEAPETDESPVTLQIAGAETTEDGADESTSTSEDSSNVAILIGIAAIAALGVVAFMLWRRSKESGLLDDDSDADQDSGPGSNRG